jgi:bifunctional N-acetylglucosamine-1-phosphate-uridyltransferase/glucosamine-1-phosphate-acetyltransferase GlmU-like protein
MPHIDLYIIAAGNGSRLNAGLPKALVPICDEPCITTTLRRIGANFRKVFVVTNLLAGNQWRAYFRDLETAHPELASRTQNLPIESGLGDGHATLQGLLSAERMSAEQLPEDIVIAWGDTFFRYAQIIDELLFMPLEASGLFPVVHEKKPYVSLLADSEMRCVAVDFSKYGEHHATGFHDQSVFRFVRSRLKASLLDLHNSLWKNDRYITPGGELSLLYAVHQLYNTGDPVRLYETRYPTGSFNTLEELVAIRRGIGIVNDQEGAYPEGA